MTTNFQSFSGNVEIGGNLSVTSGITGVASSATQLQTARNIGGVSFDGTADINLPGVDITGTQDTSGNSATATQLQTARNITLTGDVTGTASFDGSVDISISTTSSGGGGGFDATADPVAIGTGAGFSGQNNFSVAIGYQSSYLAQGSNSVAIGYRSGYNGQDDYCVAVGPRAGEDFQGYEATAVGGNAGYTNQGNFGVAIGKSAGFDNQGEYCIAIGNQAGLHGQNNYAIAIGKYAGGQYQGDYSIALGYHAGATNQHDNTIVLNATGSALNTTVSDGTYITPIRNVAIDGGLLGYNTSTKEVIRHTGFSLTSTGDFSASGNVTAYSDKRLKSDIQRIESALDKVCNLTGYTFTMNNKRATGLIAQEVLEVLPEAVMGSEEDHYSLAYGNMVGILVEAIKELSSEVKSLKQKVLA
jgi:hypothetical protein